MIWAQHTTCLREKCVPKCFAGSKPEIASHDSVRSIHIHVSDALVPAGNLANWSEPKGKQEDSKLITFFSLKIQEKG